MRTNTKEILTDLFLTKEEGDVVLKVLNLIDNIGRDTDTYNADILEDFRKILTNQFYKFYDVEKEENGEYHIDLRGYYGF